MEKIPKICSKCGIEKNISEFHRTKGNKDGYKGKCKTCSSIDKKRYSLVNKEEIRTRNEIYRQEHKEEIRERAKNHQRKWCQKNKEKIAIYGKKWRQKHKKEIIERGKRYYQKNREKIRENPQNKLHNRIKSGIHAHFKLNKVKKSGVPFLDIVPWNMKQLKKRLKKTLPDGYDWQKDFIESSMLHIDHVIPKSTFKFKKYTDEGFQRCWALSNLRLLPANENLRKSNSIREYGPLFNQR